VPWVIIIVVVLDISYLYCEGFCVINILSVIEQYVYVNDRTLDRKDHRE
jgi:hypothetical protein